MVGPLPPAPGIGPAPSPRHVSPLPPRVNLGQHRRAHLHLLLPVLELLLLRRVIPVQPADGLAQRAQNEYLIFQSSTVTTSGQL